MQCFDSLRDKKNIKQLHSNCLKFTDVHSSGHSHSSYRKPTKSQHDSAPGSTNATPNKCKRPMNAFMLFAKKFRVEYTQMYPGKDNRYCRCTLWCASWISVVYPCLLYSNMWSVRVERSASSLVRGGRRCEVRSGERSPCRPKPSQTNRKGSTQTAGNANEQIL